MIAHALATPKRTPDAFPPWFRSLEPVGILFVIFGGLVVLQSSQQLSLIKVVYLAGCALALMAAIVRIRLLAQTEAVRLARPLLISSAVFGMVLVVSLPLALVHGTPFSSWARDAAPYFLFAATPLFALHANASFSKRQLIGLLVLLGLLGTVAYAVEWLGPIRRSFAHLPLTRFGLASLYLPAALFAYATTAAIMSPRRRPQWAAVVGLVGSLVFVTGTRLALAMLLATLPALVPAWKHGKGLFLRGVATYLGSAVILLVIGLLILQLVHLNTPLLLARFESLPRVVTNPASDLSFRDHFALSVAAWNAFTAAPVLGQGPGHVFNFTGYTAHSTFSSIDSSVGFLAKFGLVGVIVMALLLLRLVSLIRRLVRNHGPTTPTLALSGFLLVGASLLAFELPLEDKGLSFALLILMALSLPQSVDSTPAPPG